MHWARYNVVKKNQKTPFKKFVIFPRIFLSILLNIGLYFYTNPVSKYMVFIKTLQNIILKKSLVFMHTIKSLKDKKKKIHIVFSYNEKNSKICISMYFGFNNQFIKVMRTRLIFQK